MSNIPSDEDFSRAKHLARERAKNLDLVIKAIKKKFGESSPLHHFVLMPQKDNEFWAGVFFKKEIDILECQKNGITDAIKNFVYEELHRQGRGAIADIKVVFEIDSDENVAANYGGNYSLRLR